MIAWVSWLFCHFILRKCFFMAFSAKASFPLHILVIWSCLISFVLMYMVESITYWDELSYSSLYSSTSFKIKCICIILFSLGLSGYSKTPCTRKCWQRCLTNICSGSGWLLNWVHAPTVRVCSESLWTTRCSHVWFHINVCCRKC